MNFTLIGTGNVAWFMGLRLTQSGHTCSGVCGRNAEAARELANELFVPQILSLSEIQDGLDACIIAVSDNAIPEVAQALSFRETVLLHTAGSVSINALNTAAPHRGVLWPIYSILKNNLPPHRDIPFAWDASTPKAQRTIVALAESLGQFPFQATDEQRRYLHLTAVLGNNFVNHLLTICESICKEQNLPFSALQPILQQTFDRTKTRSPYELQSGPAIRKDDATIAKHLGLLEGHSEWQSAYKALTESIQKMYRRD